MTENLSGGFEYLADLLGEFRGEMRLAVAAYYCGSRNIQPEGTFVSQSRSGGLRGIRS